MRVHGCSSPPPVGHVWALVRGGTCCCRPAGADASPAQLATAAASTAAQNQSLAALRLALPPLKHAAPIACQLGGEAQVLRDWGPRVELGRRAPPRCAPHRAAPDK